MPRKVNPLTRLEARETATTASGVAWVTRDQQLAGENFYSRVVRGLMDRLSRFGSRVGSGKSRNDMQALLVQAGNPGGLTARHIPGLRLLMGLLFACFGFIFQFLATRLIGFLGDYGTRDFLLLGLLVYFMLGIILLPFVLRILIRKRQRKIQRTLPDVLDLLTIAVEAGLGFDMAMNRVGERYRGTMGDELVRTNYEIRMGRPWNEAMRDMADRTGVVEVHGLVVALIQAKELGVNLGNVLRAQSLRLREERARQAREQAQKAPTKMIFPLVLFIFPALFVVLMGPAVLRAREELKGAAIPGLTGAQ